jgi:hypothetical protein
LIENGRQLPRKPIAGVVVLRVTTTGRSWTDQFHRSLLDTPRRMREGLVNVLGLEAWIRSADLFSATPGREQPDHRADGNTAVGDHSLNPSVLS